MLIIKIAFAVSVLVLILTLGRLIYVLVVIPSRGDDDVIRKFARKRRQLVFCALLISALIVFLDTYVRKISWEFLPPSLAIGSFFVCYLIKHFRRQARVHRVFSAEPETERRLRPAIIFDYAKAKNPRLRQIHWTVQKNYMIFALILFLLFPVSFLIWVGILEFAVPFLLIQWGW